MKFSPRDSRDQDGAPGLRRADSHVARYRMVMNRIFAEDFQALEQRMRLSPKTVRLGAATACR